MTIWEYISFEKFVLIKNYNDWIINCDLTKFHHSISTQILSYLEGLMYVEDSFCQSFGKKILQCAMIIVSYHWHYKVPNTPENTVDSYFIAGFVLSPHWRISRQIQTFR